MPCTGFVRELGLVARVCFADKRDEDKVQVGDVVGVRLRDVTLSERYVWFEFTGVVGVPASKVREIIFYRRRF